MSEKSGTVESANNNTTATEELKDLKSNISIKTVDKVTTTKKHKNLSENLSENSSANNKIQNINKTTIAIEKPRDLSVSDAIYTDGTGNNTETAISDDEGSIVETVSINRHSSESRSSVYKKTIKELDHKYNKYKYKLEMQKRKIKEVLKKHDQMELYNEIIGHD